MPTVPAKNQSVKNKSNIFLSDKVTISTRVRTDEGYLIVDAAIARAGIYEYTAGELGIPDKDPNQVLRVLRTEDEVFKPESMESFRNKPVTNNHPPGTLLDSSNVTRFKVGHSETVDRDGDLMNSKLHIMDADAVRCVENGKCEISNGYLADVNIERGTDDKYGPYDAIQKNIRGNHIAIVDSGRAGQECRIADNLSTSKEKAMKTVVIDGKSYEVTTLDAAALVIELLQSKLKDAEEAAKKKKEEEDEDLEEVKKEAKKTNDKLQAELDDAKSKIVTDEQLDALVADRADLVAKATKLVDGFETQGKSNMDIKREAVQVKCDDVEDASKKSDDYIDARFDGLCDSFRSGGDNLEKALADSHTKGGSGDEGSVEKARQATIDRNQSAWKKEGGKE